MQIQLLHNSADFIISFSGIWSSSAVCLGGRGVGTFLR